MTAYRIILFATLGLAMATGCSQDRGASAPEPAPLPSGDVDARQRIASGNILWFVDGREVPAAVANAVDPQRIRSVEVLKGSEAISRFGERAANGAVVMSTRDGAAGR